MTHTPGPWVNDEQIIRSKNTEVADVFGNADGRAGANARLIAAAPELLESLIELLDEINNLEGVEYTRDLQLYQAESVWFCTIDRARAVAAKAKGDL